MVWFSDWRSGRRDAGAALHVAVVIALLGCVSGSPASSSPSTPVISSGTDCSPAQVGDRCGVDKGWPAHVRCNGTAWLTVQVCPAGTQCETTVSFIGCVQVAQRLPQDADTDGGGDVDETVKCPKGTQPKFDPFTGQVVACVVPGADAAQGDLGKADDVGATADVPPETATFDAGPAKDIAGDSGFPTEVLATVDCKPDATGLEKWFNCEPKPGTSGKLHGEACSQDSECLYGHCMFGLPLAYYDKSVGVCTKNCGYVGGGSQFIACAAEESNPPGAKYYCVFEKSAFSNTMRDKSLPNLFKVCARGCKTDADCASVNPALPTCLKTSTQVLTTNPNGVCVKVK